MFIHPYLNFDGQCEEAFRFYEQLFGGTIESIMKHGDSPIAEEVPPEWRDTVLHAQLVIGDNVLLASDAPPDRYVKPAGFYISIQIDDAQQAERIFSALAEDGDIHMPFEQTFWAYRFGMVADQYNIPWMINCNPRP